MPIIDITPGRGRTIDELRTLADAIHAELVTEFVIPPEDRFQVIRQTELLRVHELRYTFPPVARS